MQVEELAKNRDSSSPEKEEKWRSGPDVGRWICVVAENFLLWLLFSWDIGSNLRGRMGRRYWQFKERKV